jgi:excinuclease ABC subunit C
MVDGGKGQLSAAVEVLAGHGLGKHPVIGLAKRLEEVFVPDQASPVMVPRASSAINLLKRVRDEAHRFAIDYHRKVRSKRIVRSELDDIPGVGEKRRNLLLQHFGSVAKLSEAEVDAIGQVKGIPRPLAQKLYDHFHSTPSRA